VPRVRVAVNGYGTIGKRVADAIALQDDMLLVGVSKTRPNYEALTAAGKGYKLYVPEGSEEEFERKGIQVSGTIEEMISKSDIVVDATPGGVGAKYKPLYVKHGVKAVFQGGEKPSVAEASFNSLCNYAEALGKSSLRVVSCNTTGLLRLICVLNREIGVRSVRAVIARRAADPKEVGKGPVNAIILNPPRIPSHHGVDVKTVLPWLDIATAAVVVPTTLMHVHTVIARLKRNTSVSEIIGILEQAPRIILVDSGKTGVRSTAELAEMARDQGRPRGDIPELIVWADSIRVDGDEAMLFQAVHQESIVVPENIDAIRAAASLASNPWESISKTDSTLGLKRWW